MRNFSKEQGRQGFSLVDVLVGTVILFTVAGFGLTASRALRYSHEIARNNLTATNLLQQSQEELRYAIGIGNNYDSIQACDFPAPGEDAACGLEAHDPVIFPGMERHYEIDFIAGSTELKKATVSVRWQGVMGSPRQVQSVMLLARPPDPLPANLYGLVSNALTGRPVRGARIVLNHERQDVVPLSSVTSAEEDGINYDFSDPSTGIYRLETGSWSVEVTHRDYETFGPVNIVPHLVNNESRRYDIELDPKPRAYLRVNIVDLAGSPVTLHDRDTTLRAYHDGGILTDHASQKCEVRGGGLRSVEWEFTDEQISGGELAVTVNTSDAYQSFYVGDFDCDSYAGTSLCADGWSSSFSAGHSWNGGGDGDTVILRIGETTEVDVPLRPVPQAVVYGQFTLSGQPLTRSAALYMKTSRWASIHSYASSRCDPAQGHFPCNGIRTTATGTYRLPVPALQEFLPDTATHQLRIQAREIWADVEQCCQTVEQTRLYDSYRYLDADGEGSRSLLSGTIEQYNTDKVPPPPYVCGDVEGEVFDDKTGDPIVSGAVQLSYGGRESTDGSGDYEYVCPDPMFDEQGNQTAFRVKKGNNALYAWKGGYYSYRMPGNLWYDSGSSYLYVKENERIDAGRIELWPRGYGDLRVTVLDADTAEPLNGMTVDLSYYSSAGPGDPSALTTDDAGSVLFSRVLETWPPEDLPETGYKTTVRRHSAAAEDPAGRYLQVNRDAQDRPVPYPVSVIADGLQTLTILMEDTGGGM
ncbi:MAG: hypothetical protein ACLFPX_02055 [Candidatus Omnitrophota bacterium]